MRVFHKFHGQYTSFKSIILPTSWRPMKGRWSCSPLQHYGQYSCCPQSSQPLAGRAIANVSLMDSHEPLFSCLPPLNLNFPLLSNQRWISGAWQSLLSLILQALPTTPGWAARGRIEGWKSSSLSSGALLQCLHLQMGVRWRLSPGFSERRNGVLKRATM